jgi:hypothetical protein
MASIAEAPEARLKILPRSDPTERRVLDRCSKILTLGHSHLRKAPCQFTENHRQLHPGERSAQAIVNLNGKRAGTDFLGWTAENGRRTAIPTLSRATDASCSDAGRDRADGHDAQRLWLLARRLPLGGLSFTGAHTVHLGALMAFAAMSHRRPPASNLIPGGLAFALMLAMAATSNDRSLRAMGPWWKRMHRVGIHYLWSIFVFTFYAPMRSNDMVWGPGFLIFGLAGLGSRIAASTGRVIAEDTAEVAAGS